MKRGKPPLKEEVKQLIRELHDQGKTYREIHQEVYYIDSIGNKRQVSLGSISNILSH